MKNSFYKTSTILKCLGRLAESPVLDDLIFISNLSEEEWNEFEEELNEFEAELKMTIDKFLVKKDLN